MPPPFHIDNIASLLKPWSGNTFPTCGSVGLHRPLCLPSLPTKTKYNPDRAFPLPRSDSEVLLFSDGSKTGKKVGAAFTHLHPPDPTTRSHLRILPPDSPTTPQPYPPSSITGPTYPLFHGTCLYSMQSYMPPVERSSMPHLSLPLQKSSV